jgi:cell division protein FtsN
MLGGFFLGIVVAGAVYVYGRLPADRPQSAVERESATVTRPQTVTEPTAQTAAEEAPPAEPTGETRFEFYDLLPEFEVVVPETAAALRADAPTEALTRSGNYIIQAGSFRALPDADRRQARIALLGIESSIQRVAIDNDVFHRVRIGPITELAELNRIRRRLRDERIDYLLIETPD